MGRVGKDSRGKGVRMRCTAGVFKGRREAPSSRIDVMGGSYISIDMARVVRLPKPAGRALIR